jgi:hypothetical protein
VRSTGVAASKPAAKDNVFARAETAGRDLKVNAQGQTQAPKQSAGMAA